jgi:hypothetical protein
MRAMAGYFKQDENWVGLLREAGVQRASKP